MLAGCVPWPAALARRYREEGYWVDVTLGGQLAEWADAYEDAVAVTANGRRLTYRQLDRWAQRLSEGMLRLGIAPGDRVVVQLPNVLELLPVFFALCRLGALPVLALPAHREHEIGALCELTGASAYVVVDSGAGFDYVELARRVRLRAPALRHVLVAGDPAEFVSLATLGDVADEQSAVHLKATASEDVAFFLLSGGTTGLPKLIPRTHTDYAYNVRASAQVCGFDRSTVYLAVLPASHNFALGCPGVLGALHAGGRVVLSADPSPDHAFALIEKEQVTVTALVPPLAMLWMQAVDWLNDDLSSLQLLQVGGAKLPAEAARQVRPTLGCRLQQVFGMGEGLLCYTRTEDPDDLVVNTQGRPLSPADELRVVDDDGQDVPVGRPGHLLTRGPYTLRGYYLAGDHNATAFTPDGYYRTGDVVQIRPDGHLVSLGRAKEVINRGGEKVAAAELENELLAHPAIREVAVVPMPDPVLGERICAFVVPDVRPGTERTLPGTGRRTDLTRSDIIDFLEARGLATYKLPDRLEVVDRLPLTTVGKVNKRELASRLTTH